MISCRQSSLFAGYVAAASLQPAMSLPRRGRGRARPIITEAERRHHGTEGLESRAGGRRRRRRLAERRITFLLRVTVGSAPSH